MQGGRGVAPTGRGTAPVAARPPGAFWGKRWGFVFHPRRTLWPLASTGTRVDRMKPGPGWQHPARGPAPCSGCCRAAGSWADLQSGSLGLRSRARDPTRGRGGDAHPAWCAHIVAMWAVRHTLRKGEGGGRREGAWAPWLQELHPPRHHLLDGSSSPPFSSRHVYSCFLQTWA